MCLIRSFLNIQIHLPDHFLLTHLLSSPLKHRLANDKLPQFSSFLIWAHPSFSKALFTQWRFLTCQGCTQHFLDMVSLAPCLRGFRIDGWCHLKHYPLFIKCHFPLAVVNIFSWPPVFRNWVDLSMVFLWFTLHGINWGCFVCCFVFL